ncbi:hypothetical protein SAMN03080598_00367 [Algoriphagus boritolerans DSM 17298 = JCM 18970]|uniref:Uncharacterized protein n=1 Tax=Algoriphagus boritolerans DSM 17298 = JCM 18970 TaxID=1120964 RepID=A0A1H5SAW9_9BACT|nr:hypothetical protein SAMN03080598_00367 [Algoriphagus boritolerans DSM 17298 = JCM 18970]
MNYRLQKSSLSFLFLLVTSQAYRLFIKEIQIKKVTSLVNKGSLLNIELD